MSELKIRDAQLEDAARLKEVGKKFERWYDIKWFQKKI